MPSLCTIDNIIAHKVVIHEPIVAEPQKLAVPVILRCEKYEANVNIENIVNNMIGINIGSLDCMYTKSPLKFVTLTSAKV
jgi:hypothetical protein